MGCVAHPTEVSPPWQQMEPVSLLCWSWTEPPSTVSWASTSFSSPRKIPPSEGCLEDPVPYSTCSQLGLGPLHVHTCLAFWPGGLHWLMVGSQVIRSSCSDHSSWFLMLWPAGPDTPLLVSMPPAAGLPALGSPVATEVQDPTGPEMCPGRHYLAKA